MPGLFFIGCILADVRTSVGSVILYRSLPSSMLQLRPTCSNWLDLYALPTNTLLCANNRLGRLLVVSLWEKDVHRNMDLVRAILQVVESHKHGFAPRKLNVEGYTEEQIGYHSYMLMQAGLVEGLKRNLDQAPSPSAIILNLTWAGHEFLSSSRSPSIWAQAKQVIAKAGDGSFGIWQAVLTDLVKGNLGLSG